MFITQEADYAVRIVYSLAKHGTRCDARTLSEEMCVSLRFALKILGKLSGAGVVNSFKGNRGGYELAKTAEETTLKDVLNAVDGPYLMSRCLCEGECNRDAYKCCPFQSTYSRISHMVNEELEKATFAQMLAEEAESEVNKSKLKQR